MTHKNPQNTQSEKSVESDKSEIPETVETVETPIDQDTSGQTEISDVDPVIEFLASLQFDTNIFHELELAHEDPDRYEKFFHTPDVFVLNAGRCILAQYDPNKDSPEGSVDNRAFFNLLSWFLIKILTDPVWMSYLCWYNRFMAAHTSPSSYYPLKYHHRFAPNHFFVRGQDPVAPVVENKKMQDPIDAFKWEED